MQAFKFNLTKYKYKENTLGIKTMINMSVVIHCIV